MNTCLHPPFTRLGLLNARRALLMPSNSDLAAGLFSTIDVPLYPLAGQRDSGGEVGRDGDVEEEEQGEHEGVYERGSALTQS
jgi:hypothetical protein